MVGIDRHLDWEGAFNVRDLGGLPTADAGRTRVGAVVRADSLEGLSAAGWEAVVDYGVRTVVDLRNHDEIAGDVSLRPAELSTLHIALDALDETEFWNDWMHGPQFATPLYYGAHLERFPERSAQVIAAIAEAPPGGVAFHCGSGRDRAGQIAMLVLSLVGVAPDVIADDYELSAERLVARYAALGEPDIGPELAAFLAERGTSAREVIFETLATLDVAATLRKGGLTEAHVLALRGRMLSGDDHRQVASDHRADARH